MPLKIVAIFVVFLVVTAPAHAAIPPDLRLSTENIMIIPVTHIPVQKVEVKRHMMGEKPDLKPLQIELKNYRESYLWSSVLPMAFLIMSTFVLIRR